MTKILGHRGDPARFDDNTLAGIESAAQICDGVEVDFRRCGSGELVLSHDPVVSGLHIAETPLDVLVEQCGIVPAFELFASDFDADLDLEVKNSPADPGFESDHGLAIEVAERARDRDVLTCFYWPTADAVAELMPGVATGLLFEGDVEWAAALNHAIAKGHRLLAPHESLIDARMVDAAHQNLIEVAAWTVDERRRVIELVKVGVDTIITNRPADVAGWIQEDFE